MKLSDLTTYEIIEEKNLSDIHSQSTVLRHKKSGAKVAVISNDDENKVFYIGFRILLNIRYCAALTSFRLRIRLWNL